MTILEQNTSSSAVSHSMMANAIRALAMDAVEAAKSGHPGMPMGMADAATVLFTRFLKFDPADPGWPDRDRFVLSAGHGSMLLYAILYLTGYEDFTLDQLRDFRQLGSYTAGHPEFGHARGIETTTGPLGQGLANAVGMALAERILANRFGSEAVDHYTYALAGDGCLMEGISHEAASLAGHLGLGKLIVLYDDNHVSIDGPTELTMDDDHLARFAAYGWHVLAVDGHDPEAVAEAIAEAREAARPSLIPTSRAPPPPTARPWGRRKWRPRARFCSGPIHRSKFPTRSSRPGAGPGIAVGPRRKAGAAAWTASTRHDEPRSSKPWMARCRRL
jgi:transketolase